MSETKTTHEVLAPKTLNDADFPLGATYWLVQHDDNSDHGQARVFFRSEESALDYWEEIGADLLGATVPASDDPFHPVKPGTPLNARLFRIARID